MTIRVALWGVGLCLSLSSLSAFARDWQRVQIPGAYCGNGTPYSVYLDLKNTEKTVVYFQGGGACWNNLSCFGKIPLSRTAVSWPSGVEAFFSDDSTRSPAADYSMIYVPYCSGDVYAGRHDAKYGKRKMIHRGAENVEKAFSFLSQSGQFPFDSVKTLLLYGYSAGAIGAFIHLDTIGPHFPAATRKLAIFDAPGLHFSKHFWDKFTTALVADYKAAFDRLGIPFDRHSGNIGQYMLQVCKRHPDWEIGTLQGSQDIVMSALFSAQHPYAHERMIYGPKGIYEVTSEPGDNCSAWVPRTLQHTFLINRRSSRIKAGVVSAAEFVADLIEGYGGLSYRD